MYKDVKSSNMSVLALFSLIFGFISIFTCFWWYISIPSGVIGIICIVYDLKLKKQTKGDPKILLSVVGILLALIIVLTSVFFSIFNKEYKNEYYSLTYNTKWKIEEGLKYFKIIYKNDENTYLRYYDREKLSDDFDISKNEEREEVYDKIHKELKSNARIGQYNLLNESKEFTNIGNNIYVANVAYTTYDNECGKFYIVISKNSDLVITFRLLTPNKYIENVAHPDVEKVLKSLKYK